jgi:hypothetical protein
MIILFLYYTLQRYLENIESSMYNLQYDGMQLDEEEEIRRSDSSSLLKLYKEHQECKYE